MEFGTTQLLLEHQCLSITWCSQAHFGLACACSLSLSLSLAAFFNLAAANALGDMPCGLVPCRATAPDLLGGLLPLGGLLSFFRPSCMQSPFSAARTLVTRSGGKSVASLTELLVLKMNSPLLQKQCCTLEHFWPGLPRAAC